MVTTLFLVRHAAHGLLGRVLTGRMPGVGLSAEGVAQASGLAGRFAGAVAVVSGPLERAQQTAAPIAAALGVPVETDAGFDEIDFGTWTGQVFAALQGAAGWDDWNRFRGTAVPPGGEPMLAAQARALAAAMRLRHAYPDGAVVVVSHQDVLKALLAHWLAVPLDLMHRIELGPASRSIVRLWDGDARVDGVNLPP